MKVQFHQLVVVGVFCIASICFSRSLFGCDLLKLIHRISFGTKKNYIEHLDFLSSKMEITAEDWELQLAAELPKIELHLHLDGSLSPDFISRRAKARGIELPVPASELRRWLHNKKAENVKKVDQISNSTKNWPVFDFCNHFLQTQDELTEATEDILDRLTAAPNNVVYAEIRFCPTLHTLEGLTPDQAVEAVIKGFRNQSSRSGIRGGILIAALRSLSSEHGTEMANLAEKYLQRNPDDPIGVVGLDVAGDEGLFPLSSDENPMTSGVRRAGQLRIPVSVHAGEWPEKYGTVENVRFAFEELGVRRIGHGIALRSDLRLLEAIKESGKITIEVCLTSNVGQGIKVASYDLHPAKLFFDHGLPFSLSSDNLLLSGNGNLEPSPYHEVLMLAKKVIDPTEQDPRRGWKAVQFSLKSGARATFSPSIGQNWIQEFDKKIDKIFQQFLK